MGRLGYIHLKWVKSGAVIALLVGAGLFAGLAYFHLRIPPPPRASASIPGAPVPTDSFTGEQLAVYRAALLHLRSEKKGSLLISAETNESMWFGEEWIPGCANGLGVDSGPPKFTHRFTEDILDSFGVSSVRLVSKGETDAKSNRRLKASQKIGAPSRQLGPGEPLVRGYYQLGEVRFDATHTHAALGYDFVCRGLCGEGEVVLLVKTGSEWKVTDSCVTWYS